MSTIDASKSVRLGFRASAAQRALLERAALASDKTLTEYVLDASCAAAENTILDQRLFFANTTDFAKFERAMNAPAKVSRELRELLSKSAPWE